MGNDSVLGDKQRMAFTSLCKSVGIWHSAFDSVEHIYRFADCRLPLAHEIVLTAILYCQAES